MTAVHIASFIVRARPELASAVAERIARAADTEIHAVESGKIIVVMEAAGERELADRMEEVRHDPDVLMVSLVYHQIDGQIDGQIDSQIDDPMDDGVATAEHS